MTIYEHTSYRSFLKDVLVGRSEKNKSYSLRALAKNLQISAPALSQVLKGHKNFSLEMAQHVAKRLELGKQEAEYFRLLVQLETSKNEELKESVLHKIQSLNPKQKIGDLNVDLFRIISDWYHFALLIATELDHFDSRIPQIAELLSISENEAELAVERLLRIEMLERDSGGRLRKTPLNPRVSDDKPNKALRSYHRQNLQKAIESLETQTPQEKFIGSETMSIDSDDLAEYAQISEEYFLKMLALSEKSKKRDHVYHLGIQFFRFTRKGSLK